jgi:hypothetical protein
MQRTSRRHWSSLSCLQARNSDDNKTKGWKPERGPHKLRRPFSNLTELSQPGQARSHCSTYVWYRRVNLRRPAVPIRCPAPCRRVRPEQHQAEERGREPRRHRRGHRHCHDVVVAAPERKFCRKSVTPPLWPPYFAPHIAEEPKNQPWAPPLDMSGSWRADGAAVWTASGWRYMSVRA